tara:strand:+ start:66 stop:509 length:444 start_codon:yes stop_codon:yes gene_type:complete
MFSTFDKSTFPIIKVTLDGGPESDTDFQLFLDQWLELYDDKKDFIFFFNTENVRSPPLKYCLKMSYFIKELRKKEYQYLQKSILLINSNKVKWLLDLIFLIQPPVAPVYIYHIDNGILDNLNDNIKRIINHPETIFIAPNEPFLSIF